MSSGQGVAKTKTCANRVASPDTSHATTCEQQRKQR
jgi:hypothetical protein